MPDSYHFPALVLTVLLLPAFFQLYLRFRDTRTLLWFLGFFFASIRMLQFYNLGWWNYTDINVHPWIASIGQASILVSAGLFLASLSPVGFRIGRLRILYAVPFTIPLVAYAFLINGVYGGNSPAGFPFLIFPALGGLSLFAACAWAFAQRGMPRAIALVLCITLGGAFLWVCIRVGGVWPLTFVECAVHSVTALLVFYVFRRISAGTILASLGFLAWSLNVGQTLPFFHHDEPTIWAIRAIAMSKVLAAIGMILLTLEDQLTTNQEGHVRERHAREEMEAYGRLDLARRRVDDFDRQASLVCQSIVANSRFSEIYGLASEQVKPGTTLRQILEFRMAKGDYAGLTPEEFLKKGFYESSELQTLANGRVVSVLRHWLPDGGILTASPVVEAVYSGSFAYPRGDTTGGRDFAPTESLEAGVALRGIVRSLFTYKGSFAYRFTAGTADTWTHNHFKTASPSGLK